MSSFDVAIIGGGIVGCSAAFNVAARGASALVVERGRCGAQASGVNYGGVRQQGRNAAELPIAMRSRKIWADLEQVVGRDCEFEVSGHLKLATTGSQMEELEAYRVLAKGHGLELELIGPTELRRRYDYLGPKIAGGSYCADDGHANPRLVTPAIANAARARGATIREMVAVTSVVWKNGVFVLTLSDGTTHSAPKLVNAAGAWGHVIARQFDEEVPEDTIAPNMVVTEPIDYFIEPNLGVCGGDIYLRQIRRGNVILGAGEGWANRDTLRARPLPEITAEACALAVALVPRLADAQIIRSWAGIEGWLPDGLPVLGPSVTKAGLFHAFGFCGHGFQMGPAVGAILCELALDGETPTPIDAFAITRFAGADLTPAAPHATPHPSAQHPGSVE